MVLGRIRQECWGHTEPLIVWGLLGACFLIEHFTWQIGCKSASAHISVCFCNLYLYCLCGEAGLMLVARSLGKARNSSPSMFRLLSLRCMWSCVLSALRTAARAILRQRASSLDLMWGCNPVGLVTSGVMPMKQSIKAEQVRTVHQNHLIIPNQHVCNLNN